MEKIDKKIVDWNVLPAKEAQIDLEVQAIIDTPDEVILANSSAEEITRLRTVITTAVKSVPSVRPRRLDNTWRLKPPHAEHSLRVTLVANITPEGKKVPYEILLNTKNPETFMHLQAHALVISSYFKEAYKTGISLNSLIQTLKDVFDPKYPSYRVRLRDSDEKPTLVHSIVAEIGYVIEEFYEECLAWNYSNSSQENPPTEKEKEKVRLHTLKEIFVTTPTTKSSIVEDLWQITNKTLLCPKCGNQLTKQSGCDLCLDCGYSKCS